MQFSTVNFMLDFVLIAAAVWMIIAVRGLGGIVGKSLNTVTAGAFMLGVAHLLSTITKLSAPDIDRNLEGMIHRLIVLVGFVILAMGFRQIYALKR